MDSSAPVSNAPTVPFIAWTPSFSRSFMDSLFFSRPSSSPSPKKVTIAKPKCRMGASCVPTLTKNRAENAGENCNGPEKISCCHVLWRRMGPGKRAGLEVGTSGFRRLHKPSPAELNRIGESAVNRQVP